jgi:tetrahydrodipicolinate N-succinyltransferase
MFSGAVQAQPRQDENAYDTLDKLCHEVVHLQQLTSTTQEETMEDQVIWWHTVKYDRNQCAYLVLDRWENVIDAYEHDPASFDDRRRAYREAMDEALARDGADLARLAPYL